MLELRNVSMRFGKNTALDEVDLHLEDGVYGLLGPNGAGKTTLMRCIAGILHPTHGKISGADNIGYLPQKFGMFKELTVLETMEYFAALKNIPRSQYRICAMECLEQVHLAERAKDKVASLSGGMVRRLGIAQTLLGSPSLIMVDEPTAGLDPEERLRFKNLISGIRTNRIILISTHIVEDVESVCDHIVILHKGRILVQSTAEDIRKKAEGKVFSVPAARKSGQGNHIFFCGMSMWAARSRFVYYRSKNSPGNLQPQLWRMDICCISMKSYDQQVAAHLDYASPFITAVVYTDHLYVRDYTDSCNRVAP